jgi:hypothetical protein
LITGAADAASARRGLGEHATTRKPASDGRMRSITLLASSPPPTTST